MKSCAQNPCSHNITLETGALRSQLRSYTMRFLPFTIAFVQYGLWDKGFSFTIVFLHYAIVDAPSVDKAVLYLEGRPGLIGSTVVSCLLLRHQPFPRSVFHTHGKRSCPSVFSGQSNAC